jgi:putative DNA primase/helicase
MRPVDRILELLEGVRQVSPDHWKALCPGHPDRNPSLDVRQGDDERVLLKCFAGCATENVVTEIGLTMADLFAESNGHREIVAAYDYTDESGELLYQVVRFAPKDFRQRRPDGNGGWEWKLDGVRRVPYRLPRILEAVARDEDILVVEGEKDVEVLERLGIAATCNPGGAGKWRPEYTKALAGSKVTIVADRDEPGREHARQVAEALKGTATELDVVEPSRGKDVSELIAMGGTIAELVEVDFLSATKESTVAERKIRLPFRPLRDAIATAPAEPEWLWEGYLAPGAVTLIGGRPKVGKSTLNFGLFAAITAGVPFLGRGTRKSGVLLLSEEREGTLAEKARRFDLNGSVDVLMRHELQGQAWPEVVDEALAYCRARGHGLLAVDTWDKFTGLRGDDENKAGPVIEALQPLMKAAGEGLSVAIDTHQRKSSGAFGEAVRGSNALTGGVDIIIELERVPDLPHARVLLGTSRFAGTPEELAAELTEEGYVARGDPEALKARVEQDRVLDVLGSEEISSKEVAEAADLPEATTRRRLEELHDQGRVERTGEGVRGSPYRWKILSATPNSSVAERKDGEAG